MSSGQVSNNAPFRYTIEDNGYSVFVQEASQTSRVNSDLGFIVESDSPTYVSIRLNAGGGNNPPQAGALVSKGVNGLGTSFRVGTYDNQGSPSSDGNYVNFFSFMATEDNTTINLTNERVSSGLIIENFGSNQFPINNIVLNKGQSYVVAVRSEKSNTNRDGLIGTLISSDKSIVVNSGSSNGSFGNGGARDYGIDQIVGSDKVGNEYILVRGVGDASYENVLIVANEDETEISVNGNSVTTINAGSYHVVEGGSYINNNMYVSTDKNVFVYQGIGGQTETNQGMFLFHHLVAGAEEMLIIFQKLIK